MKIRRNDRVAFFGQTGSGKTELARAIWIGMSPPRICVDVKDDLEDRLPGIPTVIDPSAVLDHLTVRAVPPDPADESWYATIYQLAFEQRDTLVWLDEANEVTHPSYIPRSMRKFVLQGRSRGCGHFACTPRPADVHPTFAAQAGHVFIFWLSHPRDRKAISEMTGLPPQRIEAMFDAMGGLDDHRFAHFETSTGTLTVCDPVHDPDGLTAEIAARSFGNSLEPFGRPLPLG